MRAIRLRNSGCGGLGNVTGGLYMKRIGWIVAAVVSASAVEAYASIAVSWITRYGTVNPEEIQTIASGVPTSYQAPPPIYVRMWRNISNSQLLFAPAELAGATYLQRRTYWYAPDDIWLLGKGELYTDWLGENRVSVAQDCTIVVGISGISDLQRGSLVDEGWFDLQEAMGIQHYSDVTPYGYDAYALFARNIPSGIVSVPTQTFPAHSSDESQRLVFMFQTSDQFPEVAAVPEPSSLVVMGGLFASVGVATWWRRRKDA
jgi:hypothetical protein